MAGPLDEFVARVTRMVAAFAQEHGLEEAEVRIELADGSRHLLATATAEPGFGFFSFIPHRDEGEEPRHVDRPDRRGEVDRDLGAGPRAAVRLLGGRVARVDVDAGARLQRLTSGPTVRSQPRYWSSCQDGTGASSSSVRPPFGSA